MKHSVKKQTHSRTMGPRCWFWVTQGSTRRGGDNQGQSDTKRSEEIFHCCQIRFVNG